VETPQRRAAERPRADRDGSIQTHPLTSAVRSSGDLDFKLPVNVAPVPDSDDIDNVLSVIDAVHDSVVADSDSPVTLRGKGKVDTQWKPPVAARFDPDTSGAAARSSVNSPQANSSSGQSSMTWLEKLRLLSWQ